MILVKEMRIISTMITKNEKKSGCIVLLSGGQDSTTCLYWAILKYDNVRALSFDINQKNLNELKFAELHSQKNSIPHDIIKIDLINKDARNLILGTYAAIIAKKNDISNIVLGVSQVDEHDYPDCRSVFIESLENTLSLSMDYKINLITPLIDLKKVDIWNMADKMGIFEEILNTTLTCYEGIEGSGCELCNACILRAEGLKKFILQ